MATPRRVPKVLNHEPEAVVWAREKCRLTQTQLAEIAGLSRTLLAEIEAGTRNATPVNLTKLAEALNCPVVMLERKREPETTTAATRRLRQLWQEERAEQDNVQVVRGGAVGGDA